MRIILLSTRQYDIETCTEANAARGYELHLQESHLDSETTLGNVAASQRGAY